MVRSQYQRRSLPQMRSRTEALKDYTLYELLFEVVARLREGGLVAASTKQLLIVGRACTEELAKRLMKKEGVV